MQVSRYISGNPGPLEFGGGLAIEFVVDWEPVVSGKPRHSPQSWLLVVRMPGVFAPLVLSQMSQNGRSEVLFGLRVRYYLYGTILRLLVQYNTAQHSVSFYMLHTPPQHQAQKPWV